MPSFVSGFTHSRWFRYSAVTAWLCWAGYFLLICAGQVDDGFARSVTGAYRFGADQWMAGGDLYGEGIHGFLYLPHAAIVFAPFSLLPFAWGEMVWRLFCTGTFVLGIWGLSGCRGVSRNAAFLVLSLVTMPICFSAMRNGQMTLPMAGVMMLASSALWRREFGWFVCWLVAAVLLKPVAIVTLLLAVALYPSIWRRLAVAVPVAAVIPFAFQSPEYVLGAYKLFAAKLIVAGQPVGQINFSDLAGMLGAWGIEVPGSLMTLIRISGALGAFALVWRVKRGAGDRAVPEALYMVSVMYLMLFNPRTENNTYAAFGPVLGLAVVWAVEQGRRAALSLCVFAVVLFALHHELVMLITPGREVWMSPLLVLLFSGWYVMRVIPDPKFLSGIRR